MANDRNCIIDGSHVIDICHFRPTTPLILRTVPSFCNSRVARAIPIVFNSHFRSSCHGRYFTCTRNTNCLDLFDLPPPSHLFMTQLGIDHRGVVCATSSGIQLHVSLYYAYDTLYNSTCFGTSPLSTREFFKRFPSLFNNTIQRWFSFRFFSFVSSRNVWPHLAIFQLQTDVTNGVFETRPFWNFPIVPPISNDCFELKKWKDLSRLDREKSPLAPTHGQTYVIFSYATSGFFLRVK